MSKALTANRDEARAPVWVAQAFLLSLAMPFQIAVGPFLMMPHRIVLLLFFIPFFLRLFVLRSVGPVLAADWLILGSTIWAGMALLVNHPPGSVIEAVGIHTIEFFGAYMLARVTLRSEADFRRMVRTFFAMVLLLLPFAAAESILRRPILLDLLPASYRGSNTGIRLGMRRAQTAFAHPILFGVFVSTSFGLFWYALRPRGFRFLAAPVSILSTVFSLSAGAFAAIVVQIIFITWETIMKAVHTRWRIFAIGTVLFYILIDLLSNRTPWHVIVTYLTFSSHTGYTRIQIWNFGMDNVWANPIFGLGFNDWARPSWLGSSVDNFWLLLMMRYGIPCLAMIVIALTQVISRVARAEAVDSDDKLARAGYLVAVGGLIVAGGTVHYWHTMMAFALFMFGAGAWIATGGTKSDTPPDGEKTEDETKPRSHYTRQPASGQELGPGLRRPSRNAPARPGQPTRARSRPQEQQRSK